MNGRLASLLLLAVSVVLAVLLLADRIGPGTTGMAFAIALVGLGLVSGGFRRGR